MLAHLGTTGSSEPLAASMASFHRAVHRHHLQPGSSPMLRRLLPREAEKSRNSRVTWAVVLLLSVTTNVFGERIDLGDGCSRFGREAGWMLGMEYWGRKLREGKRGGFYRQRRDFHRRRARCDSSRRGSSPSWGLGRRGRGAF